MTAAPEHVPSLPADVRALVDVPLPELMTEAAKLRDQGHGARVTYSPKVFIPLTMLCRDKCGYCTFAKPPAHLTSPFLELDDVLAIARRGAELGCREALFTLGEAPEARYPVAAEWLAARGYTATVDYLVAASAAVLAETGLLPHANAGALSEEEFARLRAVSPSQGMMIETLAARLGEPGGPHAGAPDKTPARRLAALDAAGRARVPFTTGILVGIGETREERLEALMAIRDSHARHGHVQEVIVQNFLPKDGTAMWRAPACDTDEYLWTVAAARVVLGPEMHLQAPPNLSDPEQLGALLDAGIDDWGGVSPVTPDHVNPERPWPALDALRAATEDRRAHARAAPHRAPRVRHRRRHLAPPRRALPRAAPLRHGRPRPRRRLGRRRRGRPAPGAARRAAARVAHTRPHPGGRGARRLPRGRRTRRRRTRHAAHRARRRRRRDRGGGRRPAPRHRGRRGHVRAQPQHQLHERVHVQVQVLRVLQGSAVAQPARHSLPARARGDAAARRGGGGVRRHRGVPPGWHPSRLRRELLPRGRQRGEGGRARHPRARVHRARGHRGRAAPRDAPRRLPARPQGGRPGHPAGHRGRDPRRRGAGDHLPRQGEHRGVAGGAPHRALGGSALERHDHVRPRRTPGPRGAPPRAHPRPPEGDRRVHRVRAAAVRAHGHADLPAGEGAPRSHDARGAADPRGGPSRLPGLDRQRAGVVGEDRGAGRPPGAARRLQRPRRHPHGREHLPCRRGQPRPGARRVGAAGHRGAARAHARAAHHALRPHPHRGPPPAPARRGGGRRRRRRGLPLRARVGSGIAGGLRARYPLTDAAEPAARRSHRSRSRV